MAEGATNLQGYSATKHLNIGTIVELTDAKSQTVQPATQPNMENMFGVSVDQNQLSFKLSNSKLKNETYVAISGTYNVLVSDQNGSINKGDYITMSAIDGIGMLADTKQKTVLGRSQATFDGKSASLGQSTLKDKDGKTNQRVAVGLIPVAINITRNPQIESTKVDVPEFLEKLGQQIAEKQVSPIRIYLSMAITAASIIIALVMLYSGVRSAIVSIGRNPMSKKSIFRALAEVILTSILILVIGLFAVYLLLRL
ncbi:MAG: hypothetical protein L0H36_00785 [bacterium]|nr:hypothetical protein [bacterium]